jgi:hypothetical protein
VHQGKSTSGGGAQRHRSCHQGNLRTCGDNIAEVAQLAHNRNIEQPGKRADDQPLAAH